MHWPTRLSQKLILSLTVVVTLVVVANGVIAVRSAETQLQASMLQGVDQLSGAIASATWHAMLADNREAAYQVMETIAAKQGIRSVRIYNKEGRVMFSTPPSRTKVVDKNAEACFLCHASEQPLVRVDTPTRARVVRRPDGAPDAGDDHADLQRAGVQQRRLPRPPRVAERPGRPRRRPRHAPRRRAGPRIEVRTALFTSLAIVLVGVCAAVFTRRLRRPSPWRASRTRRGTSAEMELDRPIALGSSEELAELARSFNEMRLRLAEAMAEINGFTREPRGQGGGADRAAEGRAAEADAGGPSRLARPALGERGARDQQPALRRPQPLDAHAADPEGRRHPEGAGGRVPEVPRPGGHRDGQDGTHRLRPPRLLAAEQARTGPTST